MSFCCYTLCCSCGVTARQTIKNYELKLYHKPRQHVKFPLCAAAVLSYRESYEVQVYCRQLVSSTPESLADVKSLVCKICVIYFFVSTSLASACILNKVAPASFAFSLHRSLFCLLKSQLGMNITIPLEFLNDSVNDSFSKLRIIGCSYIHINAGLYFGDTFYFFK